MSNLSPAQMAAIEKEVRRCFIEEDAPEYLSSFEQNLLQLDRIGGSHPDIQGTQWQELARAIHTLKGSAGLSQLHNLSTLAHRLEDVLLGLGNRQFPDPDLAVEILLIGVDEMRQQLAYIADHDRDSPPSSLIENIELLLSQKQDTNAGLEHYETSTSIVSTVLSTDFKDCLRRTQQTLKTCSMADHSSGEAASSLETMNQSLKFLTQDCRTLGEILQLEWLLKAVTELETIAKAPVAQRIDLLNAEVEYLETQRVQTLERAQTSSLPSDLSPALLALEAKPEAETLTTALPQPEGLPSPSAAPPVPIAPVAQIAPPTPPAAAIAQTPAPKAIEATMRLSAQQLDNLANTVGDLLIHSERLDLEQRRLRQSSQGLKKQTQKFYQLRERIQNCYDKLLLPGLRSRYRSGKGQNWLHLQGGEPGGEQRGENAGHPSDRVLTLAEQGLTLLESDFDPLELDRFTDLHTLLQDLQEFLARIDEYADDIDLSVQSAQDSRDHFSQDLALLRKNLTGTRMVTFVTLADRFRRPLWDLNQRYHKQVQLVVKGGATEIDRVVLDTLYDPLLHLIRNAFDHGQELPSERQKKGKSPKGTLLLQAQQLGTTVVISVTDDGRGIDLKKVYRLAKSRGLLRSDKPSKAELLNCLFLPGFSSSDRVGELSGRGVGLDVVKTEVEKLRGTVEVKTLRDKGTCFTLRVPSTLNILPLLVCQQQRSQGMPAVVALPSSQVLELLELPGDQHSQSTIAWRDQTLPLIALTQLFPSSPYTWLTQHSSALTLSTSSSSTRNDRWGQMALTTGRRGEGRVGVVLQSQPQPVVLQVDVLLEEREMVMKPIDSWLPVASFIGGCTVLPQGQVIPVLLPEALSQLNLAGLDPTPPLASPPTSPQTPTILVVDDSAAARRWLLHGLQPLGYEIISCRDGQEAWDQLEAGISCQLMVCDVEMPRLDGFQLLQRIRQNPQWQALPVAMLTSRQSDRHREQAKRLGVSGYFVKPLGIQELVQQIPALMNPSEAMS